MMRMMTGFIHSLSLSLSLLEAKCLVYISFSIFSVFLVFFLRSVRGGVYLVFGFLVVHFRSSLSFFGGRGR